MYNCVLPTVYEPSNHRFHSEISNGLYRFIILFFSLLEHLQHGEGSVNYLRGYQPILTGVGTEGLNIVSGLAKKYQSAESWVPIGTAKMTP